MATINALSNAKVIEQTVSDIYQLSFDYVQMNDVMRIVKDEQLLVTDQHFESMCSCNISIRKTQVNTVVSKLEQVPHLTITFLRTQ
mgnify:FL=1